MKNYQTLYEHIGHLLYSIAAADKKVTKAEIETIKDVVSKKWLSLEDSTDEYGSDAGHYIFIAFDYLLDQGATSQEAWDNFTAFYNDNRELFTQQIKDLTLNTAQNVANSFSGINKAELGGIMRLKLLFEQ